MSGDKASNRDRNLLLWLGGAVLAVIFAVSLIAPSAAGNDPRPSSDNAAPGGAKAAFLMLESLHRPVAQWNRPLEDLDGVDARHTTLLLLEPMYSALEKDRLAAAVKRFLERGGRVLTTGPEGALLLPGGSAKPGRRFGALCYTEAEGPGPLAAAGGGVETYDPVRWGDENPEVRVEARCGPDAVVVRVPVGAGEAVWWSSPAPLTNAELGRDPDLRLFLASLGPPSLGSPSLGPQGPAAGNGVRSVLFDETLQQSVRSKWTAARGLPLYWLLGQAGLIFALLVFSFSRRRGPVRSPVTVPRSSPVEFAVNMGDLYAKAGATEAALAAARRRLERALMREGGLPAGTVAAGGGAIASALETRFGGSWTAVGENLREATDAPAGHTPLKTGTALALVRALGQDAERVRRAARPTTEGGHGFSHANNQPAQEELQPRG